MKMNLREKMRYSPEVGDVLIYLDGTNYQVEQVIKTHVKLTQSGSAEDLPLKPIAIIRNDMLKNECFMCRKPDKK
jgi:hypothetical protein